METRPSLLSEAADSLAIAVIASSNEPLLLIDGDLTIIAASNSFCDTFDIDPAHAAGRPLAVLGEGEWGALQLASLLRATAGGAAEIASYEMDLVRAGQDNRCLVVNARKLDYFDADNVRLVVSVADVTEARANEKLKDDLVREKAILLQELQHRVANSLQIVASVLMQGAKKVKSEQARGHLRDAHSRVMSIASLQRQLASSQLGDVPLRDYFTDLCATIGASMIRDHDQLTLTVSVDDSVTTADSSASLGLIVTELVINALKHAFPGNRKGKILVDYRSHGATWTLSVRDNGVGYPKDAASATPGLGTGIVQALATQLGATVHMEPAKPGTLVSIVHA
jgi:two-component sensor histidine kinase